jgi:hypothetical protein
MNKFAKSFGYLVVFTLVNYVLTILFIIEPYHNLVMRLIFIVISFITLFIIARFFVGDPFKLPMRAPYTSSLIHVLSGVAIITLILLAIAILVSDTINIDMREIYARAKPVFIDMKYDIYIPLYGLIYWGFSGLIVAYLYHVVTYELFKDNGRIAGILASTTLTL